MQNKDQLSAQNAVDFIQSQNNQINDTNENIKIEVGIKQKTENNVQNHNLEKSKNQQKEKQQNQQENKRNKVQSEKKYQQYQNQGEKKYFVVNYYNNNDKPLSQQAVDKIQNIIPKIQFLKNQNNIEIINSGIDENITKLCPEFFKEKSGTPSDIWQLGLLILEIIKLKNIFQEDYDNFKKNITAEQFILQKSQSLIHDTYTSPAIIKLVELCLKIDPKNRPKTSQVIEMIEKIKKLININQSGKIIKLQQLNQSMPDLKVNTNSYQESHNQRYLNVDNNLQPQVQTSKNEKNQQRIILKPQTQFLNQQSDLKLPFIQNKISSTSNHKKNLSPARISLKNKYDSSFVFSKSYLNRDFIYATTINRDSKKYFLNEEEQQKYCNYQQYMKIQRQSVNYKSDLHEDKQSELLKMKENKKQIQQQIQYNNEQIQIQNQLKKDSVKSKQVNKQNQQKESENIVENRQMYDVGVNNDLTQQTNNLITSNTMIGQVIHEQQSQEDTLNKKNQNQEYKQNQNQTDRQSIHDNPSARKEQNNNSSLIQLNLTESSLEQIKHNSPSNKIKKKELLKYGQNNNHKFRESNVKDNQKVSKTIKNEQGQQYVQYDLNQQLGQFLQQKPQTNENQSKFKNEETNQKFENETTYEKENTQQTNQQQINNNSHIQQQIYNKHLENQKQWAKKNIVYFKKRDQYLPRNLTTNQIALRKQDEIIEDQNQKFYSEKLQKIQKVKTLFMSSFVKEYELYSQQKLFEAYNLNYDNSQSQHNNQQQQNSTYDKNGSLEHIQ
ncbi:Protein kinase-like domain [Pseudocohnilembus persalinus]|uniref:Protein kinase-like domain n=1 Tax=Pseudocohnilembus persalinus TaxID=266149 RepID=A0A0V0R3M2_PSEPJ|nr:Protein kinase-like domain [Pseudocohnilembus persalinus]|eukprot:KRX09097.1 Protein kinase-like domain [Pseudocohnilembus persalinus]